MIVWEGSRKFQSTLPAWGSDGSYLDSRDGEVSVSIHAPRVGERRNALTAEG